MPIPDGINASKPPRVTIAGLLDIHPMTDNLENPSQDIIQERVKRDPAIGSSVMITFVTDSMGFFIFLELATLLLL
jgi:hypothetical protein